MAVPLPPGRRPYGPEARRYLSRRLMAKGSRVRAFIRVRSLSLSERASPRKDSSQVHSVVNPARVLSILSAHPEMKICNDGH